MNNYALFAELAANLSLTRVGVVVQTGIATEYNTASFFAHLIKEKRLASLVDFENRDGLFTRVHRSSSSACSP